MNQQEIQRRQASYTIVLAFVLLMGTLFVYFLMQDQYHHPMPEADCSEAYDYPMCKRAVTPPAQPEPPMNSVYLSVFAVGALAILLLFLSHSASVTKQENIVAPGRTAPPAAPAAPQQPAAQPPPTAPPAQAAPQQPVAQAPVAEPQRAYPTGQTPQTIPNNTIAPNEVGPPQQPPQQPQQGVQHG